MFDRLFFRSYALTRQLSTPLVDDRRQYLAQCAAQGMSKCALRMKARLLLSIAEYLRMVERPNDTISLPAIKKVQADGRVTTALRRKARMPSGRGNI
jgi:hypothetical protein